MDQNQTIDNDLQKAIDDITNTTNTDPVFSDPVAAPSSIPEGDTGELAEPVGPFPNSASSAATPTYEPTTQYATTSNPEPDPSPIATEQTQPTTFSATETTSTTLTDYSTPEPATTQPATPPEPTIQDYSTTTYTATTSPAKTLDTAQIKTAALRDLAPLINKLPLNAEQKFGLYRNIIDVLDDKTVLGSAYETARDIPDEVERAKALLYLVESIDKM